MLRRSHYASPVLDVWPLAWGETKGPAVAAGRRAARRAENTQTWTRKDVLGAAVLGPTASVAFCEPFVAVKSLFRGKQVPGKQATDRQ